MSIYEYLAYGVIFESISRLDYAMTCGNILDKDPTDYYGLFDWGKILWHISFGLRFGHFGAEIICWVRSGYHNKVVGELAPPYSEQIAFARENFNFMSLHISQKNRVSRRVA